MGAACLVIPVAKAAPEHEAPTFYVAAGITTLLADIEGPLETLTVEDEVSFNAVTIRGGVDLDDYFAIEVESSVGVSDDGLNESIPVANTSGGFTGDVQLNYMVGVFGKGAFPIANDKRFQGLVRLGYMYGEVEAKGNISSTVLGVPVEASASLKQQSDGPVVGAGLSYALSGRTTLRGEATYIGLENTPTMAYSLTLGLKF